MSNVLWVLMSIVGYIAGLAIIMRVTPWLLLRSYDEGLFMGVAALDIMGALLVFGAVGLTYALFGGNFAVKVLDFFFLVGILVVGVRTALFSFRPRSIGGTFRVSRVIAGTYCLGLALAACWYIVQIFMAR
jgi:hypothetical protein